jgi:hypothetical protein
MNQPLTEEVAAMTVVAAIGVVGLFFIATVFIS